MKRKILAVLSTLCIAAGAVGMTASAYTFSNGKSFSKAFAQDQVRILNSGEKATARGYCGANIDNPLPASLYAVAKKTDGTSISEWISIIHKTTPTAIAYEKTPAVGTKYRITAVNKNEKKETYTGNAYLN